MTSATEAVRAARFYTSARRLPWVIGKFADWRLPLGPYNGVQVAVMSLGGLLLVKTASWWWSLLGPVPVVAWVAVIFICRRQKVAGRTPVGAALGVATRIAQPAGGRIGGRAARDRRPAALCGGFTLQGLDAVAPPAAPAADHGSTRPIPAAPATASAPASPAGPGPRRPLSPVQAALLATKADS
ncbi:hypothetical protein ABT127_34710 [Streptomyces sp. NPDC001904]|uniref:hypothetical protein n=1 Tax=Streptomyces sp. NPDC001904 TaxID=3154531 RepID=UPI00331F6EC0